MNWLEYLGWTKNEINDLRYLAYSYFSEGMFDIAINFFEALLPLDNENVYDLQELGALYLEKGQALKALDYLDKALKKDPSYLPSLINKAKVLFYLGYKKQAQALARTLLSCGNKEIEDFAEALILAYK